MPPRHFVKTSSGRTVILFFLFVESLHQHIKKNQQTGKKTSQNEKEKSTKLNVEKKGRKNIQKIKSL